MSQFTGKTAIISGGAEGIGLGIAAALGKQGMNIVLADIDTAQLKIAHGELDSQSIAVHTVSMDVTKPEDWQKAVNETIARFGKIHMLINNAGVSAAPGPIEKTNHKDWQWVIDVNLMGVVYGTQAVIPKIKEHGEGGWLLNVASMAGMTGVPYAGAYTATKVAVVGMSEAWHAELFKQNIQVSVLCPAFVRTRIHLSQRNRQDEYAAPQTNVQVDTKTKNAVSELVENGIPTDLVAARVIEALEAKEFYIFTHPSHRVITQKRSQEIDDAFARAEKSPLLQDVRDIPVFSFE
jgi:NAD(P)-dependent dehydrogenase (short-subunit alcohol dehydrogenase family)